MFILAGDPRTSWNSRQWHNIRQNTAGKHLSHVLHYAETCDDRAGTESHTTLAIEHDNLMAALQYANQQKQRDSFQRFAWALARPYGSSLTVLNYWATLATLQFWRVS